MKKQLLTVLLGAALICAPKATQAQFQWYYRWANGFNVDHGPLNECLSRVVGTVITHYACGGAGAPSATANSVTTLVGTNVTGAPMWIHMYQTPATNTQDFTGISMTDATAQSCFGILANYRDGGGITYPVVIKADYNGNYLGHTILGPGIGVSIAYDQALGDFVVLGSVTNSGNGNFEITSVDVVTMAINWENQYDGCGGNDAPSAIMVDGTDYVAVGTSTNALTGDRQIMLVKTSNVPVWAYTQLIGSSSEREAPTDICVYTDAAGAKQYGISGYLESAAAGQRLFCMRVNPAGAGAGMLLRFLTSITSQALSTQGFAITWSSSANQLVVTGRHNPTGNTNGIVVTFMNDANLTAVNLELYDNPALAGNEELRDDTRFASPTGEILYCGQQQRTVAWGTSPAFQNYAWLMTTNSVGVGTCPIAPTFTTTTLNMNFTSCTAPTSSSHSGSVTITDLTSDYQRLDNCVTPSRLANPGLTSGMRVYPNPASTELTLLCPSTDTDVIQFDVLDMTGRVVLQRSLKGGTSETQFDLSSVANGVYIYRLQVNGSIMLTDKLVVAH